MTRKIEYTYMGSVERWDAGRRRFTLRPGFSFFVDGRETQPWLTRDEAEHDAKQRGGRASFVHRVGGARVCAP